MDMSPPPLYKPDVEDCSLQPTVVRGQICRWRHYPLIVGNVRPSVRASHNATCPYTSNRHPSLSVHRAHKREGSHNHQVNEKNCHWNLNVSIPTSSYSDYWLERRSTLDKTPHRRVFWLQTHFVIGEHLWRTCRPLLVSFFSSPKSLNQFVKEKIAQSVNSIQMKPSLKSGWKVNVDSIGMTVEYCENLRFIYGQILKEL